MVLGLAAFLLAIDLVVPNAGRSAMPQLLAFVFVFYRLIPRLSATNNFLALAGQYWPFVDRIAQLLRTDDKEYMADGAHPFAGLRRTIEFRNVSLHYLEGEPWAVKDLSCVIPKGSLTALVGTSGSGKSSVADLVLRLFDPTAGEVLVDGIDLRQLNLACWRGSIGVVGQDTFLFNATVRENLTFGRPDAGESEVLAAARAANVHEFVERLANGYNTVIGDQGYRLSGGQRQRLALARAILREPEILVLDEATSDLDSRSEQLIQKSLDSQRGERTILVIAHRLSTVARADQILVLSQGQLVEQGTHDELLAWNGHYAQFWRLQSEV